jgi:hypothetical protein
MSILLVPELVLGLEKISFQRAAKNPRCRFAAAKPPKALAAQPL